MVPHPCREVVGLADVGFGAAGVIFAKEDVKAVLVQQGVVRYLVDVLAGNHEHDAVAGYAHVYLTRTIQRTVQQDCIDVDVWHTLMLITFDLQGKILSFCTS